MRERAHAGMSLYGSTGSRKYLNAAERRRFIRAARRAPLDVCLVLSLSGGRISEILAVTPAAIDLDSSVANITTLKRRKLGIFRQVHLPRGLLDELDHVFHLRRSQRDPDSADGRIWSWSRTTAWRRVKEVMAVAGTPEHRPKACATASASTPPCPASCCPCCNVGWDTPRSAAPQSTST